MKKFGYYVYPQSKNSVTSNIDQLIHDYYAIEKMAKRGNSQSPRILSEKTGREIPVEDLWN